MDLFNITCATCGSHWKVKPGPQFNIDDYDTYPSNKHCPNCHIEEYIELEPENESNP